MRRPIGRDGHQRLGRIIDPGWVNLRAHCNPPGNTHRQFNINCRERLPVNKERPVLFLHFYDGKHLNVIKFSFVDLQDF